MANKTAVNGNGHSKMDRLKASIASINKKYGPNTVNLASNAIDALEKRVIPTPSLELNNALYGGFCGIVELFGNNQSGKTSLAIETIVENQNKDPEFIAGWLETEGSVDRKILENHGVDMDRLVYWRQEDLGNAENAMDVARGFLADGIIDLLIVNSVAGLAPKTELETDIEKANIALVARLMSKFFRVANGFISKNKITVIFINQVRDNVGVMFGDPATTTGGKALSFYAHQRIRMSQLKVQASDPINASEGVKIGNKVKKNRNAGINNPYTECEYYALFNGGIDSTINMPVLLSEKGIMTVRGAHWYYLDDNDNTITIDSIEGHFSSKKEFVNVLRTNEAWRNELTNRLNGITSYQSVEEVEETIKEQDNIEAMFANIETEDENILEDNGMEEDN